MIVIIVILIVIRILIIIFFGFKKIGLSDRPPHSPAPPKIQRSKNWP